MRISRRSALALAGAAALAPIGLHLARAKAPQARARPVIVHAKAVPALLPAEPERRRFGALTYRSGLELWSDDPAFGGWSGLWRSSDGGRFVSISDRAHWLTGSIRHEDGRLAALEDVVIAPILGSNGQPLGGTRAYDVEALAMAGGEAYLGLERVHEIRRFAWARDGVMARSRAVTVPAEIKRLPSNESLEALAVAPSGHPLAGSLIAIAERARAGDDAPTRGWVVTGPRRFSFELARSQGFDITDLTFLPSGEALLLERRFRVIGGVACRIRRIAADAFRPVAMVDGDVLFEVDRGHEIDNMEGIATYRDARSGETIVTLISDDNFFFMQRTLLLEFSLG